MTNDYDVTGAKYRVPEPKKDNSGRLVALGALVAIVGGIALVTKILGWW